MARQRLRQALAASHRTGLYRLRSWIARWEPRRLWRTVRFRRWNRAAGPAEMVVRPGLCLQIDARSREPFEWFCFRSGEMSEELDGFRREMQRRRRFLDVGACHGIFSLAFAHGRPAARVVAVEPSAIACSILAENVRRNGLDNVIARQLALGAGSGTLFMRQTWHHLEALAAQPVPSSAAGSRGAGDDGGSAIVAAPMRSLDELCAELDFWPDLVKIDVEGYELAVLAGASDTLARVRPHVFLELHPERLRELGGSVADVVQLLSGLGYGFNRPGGGEIRRHKIAGRASVFRVLCTAIHPAASAI